jgi:hypothetical protein
VGHPAHEVKIAFEDSGKETQAQFTGQVKMVTFGAAEYVLIRILIL